MKKNLIVFILISSFSSLFSQEIQKLNHLIKKNKAPIINKAKADARIGARAKSQDEQAAAATAAATTAAQTTLPGTSGDLSSLGNLTSNFSGLNIIPTINVVGSLVKETDKGGTLLNVNMFFGAANLDSSKISSSNRLFIPEASKYGINFEFTKGFKKQKGDTDNIFALNLGFMCLGKDFPMTDSTGKYIQDETTAIGHFKQGFEWMIIPETLSIYYNFDEIILLDNVNDFQKYYKTNKTIFGFYDFGIKSLLTLSSSSDVNIEADLGMIVEDGDIRYFTKNSDNVIPTLRITLSKGLSNR